MIHSCSKLSATWFLHLQYAHRAFPFLGLGLAGQVTGAAIPAPTAPSPPRDAAGAARGAAKGAVHIPLLGRGGEICFREEGLSGASAAASALPWGARCGVTSAGRGLRGGDGAVLDARCAPLLGCQRRGAALGTGATGGAEPARAAEGARSRSRRRAPAADGAGSRATWQGSGLESPVCFLPLRITQCFISLENIRRCLELARLERGHEACFGVVGRVLCFEVVISKFVAQK